MHDPDYNQRDLCTVKTGVFALAIAAGFALLIVFKVYIWIYFVYIAVVVAVFVVTHWELVQDILRYCRSRLSRNSDDRSSDSAAREEMSPTEPREAIRTTDQEGAVTDVPPTYTDIIPTEPLPPSYGEAVSKSTENLQNVADNTNDKTDNIL